MNEEYLKKLEQFAEALKEKIVEFGPEAWEVTLQVVRFNAVQDLLYSFLLSAVLVSLSYWWWIPKFREGRKANKNADRRNTEKGKLRMTYSFIGVVVTVVVLIVSFFLIFDIWNWVAIFEPRLKLANEVYQKAL